MFVIKKDYISTRRNNKSTLIFGLISISLFCFCLLFVLVDGLNINTKIKIINADNNVGSIRNKVEASSSEIKKKRAVQSQGLAPLRGGLVPTNFFQHPLIGWDCFFGYSFPNCTCTNVFPSRKQANKEEVKGDSCFGPKCVLISNDRTQPAVKANFTCITYPSQPSNPLDSSAIVDCSSRANPEENEFFFSECNPYIPKPKFKTRDLNVTSVLNLFNHEFRFESIDENRHKSTITCPLKRNENTFSYLKGYTVQVDVHVHEISTGFHDKEWVTKILSCNATAIEQYVPLVSGSQFIQNLIVKDY
ncbi:hypothetical protein ABK040_015048 [Willaertia magna]